MHLTTTYENTNEPVVSSDDQRSHSRLAATQQEQGLVKTAGTINLVQMLVLC